MVRRTVVTGLGVCAAVLSVASLAWACLMATATPLLLPAQPDRSPAGAMVTVAGRQWVPLVDVEVRLDAVAGPVLAVAPVRQDGTFTTEVRIPDIAPGGHLLVAVQGEATKSTPFEVARPGTVVTQPTAGPQPGPATTDPVNPVTSQRVSGGNGADAIPPTPVPFQEPAAAGSAPVTSGPAPAGTPVPATAGSPAASVTELPTGATVTSAPTVPQPAPAAPPAAPFSVSAGDLWSGFASLGSSTEGPSLLDLPSARPARGPGSSLPASAGLLAAGLLALFGGFTAAELTRRRVPTS